MSGNLAPLPIWQFLDQNGHPLAGGAVTYYQAGTQNKVTIYADIALDTPLPNPVPLDAAGRPATGSGPTPIFFDPSRAYKQVLTDAQGRIIWTADNIVSPGSGVPGPPGPPGPPGSVHTNYAEGDWTPTLASSVDGSAGTGTIYDGQYGRWTRIGRNVFVTGRLRLSHLGTWADNPILIIGGLPFPVAQLAGAPPNANDTGGLVMTYFYNLGATAPAPSDWASMLGTAVHSPDGFLLSGFYRPLNLHEYLRPSYLTNTTDCAFTGFYLTSEAPPAEDELTNEQVIGDGGSITLPDGFSQHIIYCSNSNPLTLTGVLGAPKIGTRLIIVSSGTAPVYLICDTGNHPGAFLNTVISGPTPLNGGLAEYVFSGADGNRWLLVSHRQGRPLSTAAASLPQWYASYNGTPGSTWSVDASRVVAQQYELIGTHIKVWIELSETAFVGSGGELAINQGTWGGYTATRNTEMAGVFVLTQDTVPYICWAYITANNTLWISNLTGPFQTSTIGLNISAEFEVT